MSCLSPSIRTLQVRIGTPWCHNLKVSAVLVLVLQKSEFYLYQELFNSLVLSL